MSTCVSRKGHGKWLNRLTAENRAAICEAYRRLQSIGKVERHLRKLYGVGPSHSVIARILHEYQIKLNPVGWPPQYRVKKDASVNTSDIRWASLAGQLDGQPAGGTD